MKHLKDIEIEIDNRIRLHKEAKKRFSSKTSLIHIKGIIEGLDFCHSMIVNKISYLEKETKNS